MTSVMTKAELENLQRLVRQREKVLKSAAKQRSAELLADFENQMGQQYSFDQDKVWAKAEKLAEQEIAKAQKMVAQRCCELGIPDRFAPELTLQWWSRGENAVKERRNELRIMAHRKIAAIEAKAMTNIEMECLEAQTQLAVSGLTTDAARGFIDRLPSIENLMPRLCFEEVAGEADPPVAEQLVSSNALRQRRYRDRHRNALEASRNATSLPSAEESDA